jgi:hypothetical protein
VPGQASAGNAFARYPNGTHPTAVLVGTALPGTPSGAVAGNRIRPSSRPSACGKERIRTPSQAPPASANMAGRSVRPSGVVPPNQRMQPDAVPATEIVPILERRCGPHVIPIYSAARLMRSALGGHE